MRLNTSSGQASNCVEKMVKTLNELEFDGRFNVVKLG
jgi:hypothetical protein